MLQQVCDRCGELAEVEDGNHKPEDWQKLYFGMAFGKSPFADLCPKCVEAVQEFIQTMPANREG